MKHPRLQVQPRAILGKKVKNLRRQGLVPANVYGFGGDPEAIQVDGKSLERLLHHATASTLVELVNDGGGPVTVLLRDIQIDPRRGSALHVEFMRLNMRQTLRTTVTILLSGESPAAKESDRMILQTLEHVEVEALPDDLPSALHIDISGLEEVDASVHVRDILVPEGVTILHDPDEPVAKVQGVRAAFEELEAEVAAEAAAVAAEGAPVEAEGAPEAAAEGSGETEESAE
jgi:large subunit ribosomal protein L25